MGVADSTGTVSLRMTVMVAGLDAQPGKASHIDSRAQVPRKGRVRMRLERVMGSALGQEKGM
jgi:hypothetical protein